MNALAEQIQFAKTLLAQRVSVKPDEQGGCRILFDAPDRDEMVALGVDEEVADRIAGASWWYEMQEAVVETPEFCDPDADADEVLTMARDTIDEYISKRY